MDQLILAADGHACDTSAGVVCAPEDILHYFEFARTPILIGLAAAIVVVALLVAFRKPKLVPSKFQAIMESVVDIPRNLGKDVIGQGAEKFYPLLVSLFLFVLVGNMFEITPLVNFPITSRLAVSGTLAILVWFVFVITGIAKQGLGYFGHMIWPPGVPVAIKPVVGIIELVSTILIRPFSLAVRLFANLVAGHTMLSLLLSSAIWFLVTGNGIGGRALGLAWGAFGLFIFLFEILVAFVQAYVFTLLTAVYINSSLHPDH